MSPWPRRLYAALCVLRVLLLLSPSIVHPDEHLQGPGPAVRLLLPPPPGPGPSEDVPWEFSRGEAARSIVPPLLLAGGPLWLAAHLGVGTWGRLAAGRLLPLAGTFVAGPLLLFLLILLILTHA